MESGDRQTGRRMGFESDATDASLASLRDELKRRDDAYEATTGIKSSRDIIARDPEWEEMYQQLKRAEMALECAETMREETMRAALKRAAAERAAVERAATGAVLPDRSTGSATSVMERTSALASTVSIMERPAYKVNNTAALERAKAARKKSATS